MAEDLTRTHISLFLVHLGTCPAWSSSQEEGRVCGLLAISAMKKSGALGGLSVFTVGK